jgi:DNA-binding NtrC family response regulator
MVVEDEMIILRHLEAILSDAGANAVACRKVDDALAAIDRNKLAAAILDIQLGFESSAPVARQLERRGVPFIFYSGHGDTAPIRAEWPDRLIVGKPARPRTLVAAVADLIERS